MRLDVLVVGAGPAGVAAGIRAHDRGLRTLVVDKATFPRDKTCGDGLTAQALRLLEGLGIRVHDLAEAAVVRDTVLVSPSGREVSLPMPHTGVYSAVVPRLALDAALVNVARARGVDVRCGAALTDLGETPEAVHARVGDTMVEARHVIAADGHWSTVRRLREPEAPADLGSWHAFRQYFRGVDDPRQWVLFEEDLLPGYAWVFPLPGGRANVGFGVLRGPGVGGKHLKELWPDLLARPSVRRVLGPRAEAELTHRAWPIPTALRSERLADGPVLYIGDAAGVVDPMTGEGIAQALESGLLAVDAIAAGGSPGRVAARYRQQVQCVLGRDLRFAATLQRVLRSSLGARAAIRAAGLTSWTRRSFGRWMFEDYPRALLLTPDRWRHGAFTGQGAYSGAS
ncbi:MAG TPA: geranylgeranyl reductase family protein [Acidimicrobiia bacterium]|jgi:geranylgeranyl reductase family protein